MAAGTIKLQAADTRIYEVTAEEGAGGNVAITLPKEGGKLATESEVAAAVGAIPVTPDATETVKGKVELATTAEVQAGTDTTRAVTPAGFQSASFGLGQTWQNVATNRVAGVTYTNTTGRPIMVATVTGDPTATIIYVDGLDIAQAKPDTSSGIGTAVAIVPANSTYKCSHFAYWKELR